jgi:hypothetical protein
MTTDPDMSTDHVLRLDGMKRVAVYVALPALAVLFATLVTQELHDGSDGPADALATLVFAALVPALLVLLWTATQSWTRLHANGVESFNGFSRRAMPANAFRGYRRSRSFATVTLVPHHVTQAPLRVPITMLAARATVPWLKALGNLERDDLAARIAETEEDPRLGATPAARRKNLRELRSAAKALRFAGWAIAIWLWIYPTPYDLALSLSVAIPVAAMALHLWSRGLLRLDYKAEDPTPTIADLFYPPALALFLRAIADINMVDYVGTLLIASLCAAGLAGFLILNDRHLTTQRWKLAGMSAGLLGWMLGLLSFANARLDHDAAQLFHAHVMDAHVTQGKAHLDELVLEPWGPFQKPVSAYVPPSVYDRVSDDDVVCASLHPGRFGWRWFTIDPC